MQIILFEDTSQYEADMVVALQREAGNGETVQLFRPPEPQEEPCIYDERLKSDLVAAGQSSANLICADSDLSKLPRYNGLSEPTVRRVADELGIPECSYARGEDGAQELAEGVDMREGRIVLSLSEGLPAFARSVVAVSRGFKAIADHLAEALSAAGKRSPGKMLATILGKSEYSEKISLYASGDQNRLISVLRAASDPAKKSRRLTCLFGYWLWDSVLRYPGVVVNETAASSYLGLLESEFATEDVQRVFESCRYSGPFAGARRPLWWRGMLDDLVAESGARNGTEFVERKLRRPVAGSKCCEDPTIPAGYYCMLSKRPVSLQNSVAGLTWFPRGADLARISRTKYDEVVPWLCRRTGMAGGGVLKNAILSAYDGVIDKLQEASDKANVGFVNWTMPLQGQFRVDERDSDIALFDAYLHLQEWAARRQTISIVIHARERIQRSSNALLESSLLLCYYLVETRLRRTAKHLHSMHFDYGAAEDYHPIFHAQVCADTIEFPAEIARSLNFDYQILPSAPTCFREARIPTSDMCLASLLLCIAADHIREKEFFDDFFSSVRASQEKMPKPSFQSAKESLGAASDNLRSSHWFAHMR